MNEKKSCLATLLLTLLVSGALLGAFSMGCHPRPEAASSQVLPKPWVVLTSNCVKDGKQVCCESKDLIEATTGCIRLRQSAADLVVENNRLEQLAGVDRQVMQGKINQLEEDLASFWHNPWLTIPLGILIGGAAVLAATLPSAIKGNIWIDLPCIAEVTGTGRCTE